MHSTVSPDDALHAATRENQSQRLGFFAFGEHEMDQYLREYSYKVTQSSSTTLEYIYLSPCTSKRRKKNNLILKESAMSKKYYSSVSAR